MLVVARFPPSAGGNLPSLTIAGRPAAAAPGRLADATLPSRSLPAGWRQYGPYVSHLRELTAHGKRHGVDPCNGLDVYLFGGTQRVITYLGPTRSDDSFEEQLGRSPLPSVWSGIYEDAAVGDVETACLNQEIADGASIMYFSAPNTPVTPWVHLLGTAGVISASDTTYDGVRNLSLDVLRNGYFARFSVTARVGSTWAIPLLRAAVARM
jgi:hypothetical protein